VVELLPSWPAQLLPQHRTVPSAISAHEWTAPLVTLTEVEAGAKPVISDTETGAEL